MEFETEAQAGQEIHFSAQNIRPGETLRVYLLDPEQFAQWQAKNLELQAGWMACTQLGDISDTEPECIFSVPASGHWHILFNGGDSYKPVFQVV